MTMEAAIKSLNAKKVFGFAAATAMGLTLCMGVGTAMAAEAIDEQEPNNSFETANVIKMNQTVYGVTDDYDYSNCGDYFKVVLPVNGDVKITFANDMRADTNDRLAIRVYDASCEYVKDSGKRVDTLGSESFSVGLKRGVNYVCVPYNYKNVSYHFKLAYVVGGTNITKLTAAKKAFSTSWVKKSGVASYQIRYTPKSTYKLYDWDKAVTKTLSKSSGSAKITGLKSKTPYYVQVRVAKVIDGETYYSAWTSKKAVTTK
ncbi:MAG: hypothetical protein PUD02_05045 [Eggerthellales bacterium]|nr:hypothetical protein [Eggerthellales bacterium]